jgi:hypothetical protein
MPGGQGSGHCETPNWHLCISAASEKHRRYLGIGVGERVFQCDVAHRLRIGHSDPIVIRVAEPHLEAPKPSTQHNELAGQGGDGPAAAPQYGQALPLSRHGTQELPVCLE